MNHIINRFLNEKGECVDMYVENGNLIIENEIENITIDERIKEYGPIKHSSEFDWVESMGREMW